MGRFNRGGSMDLDLAEFIKTQQARALKVYEVDPSLLREHIGQEESFRAGGYGTRQVQELLQNAVDAVGAEENSRVELRLVDGALYCANTGHPFTRAGIEAVCHAFISPKKGDEIGRFGLGFKSILGITNHPQIYSDSISFQFNSPDLQKRLKGNFPTLRIPDLADLSDAAAEDPNIRELMDWATTVVKLPLSRDEDRLLAELRDFDSKTLLFFDALDQLTIFIKSSENPQRSINLRRVGRISDGTVKIDSSDGKSEQWRCARRRIELPDDVFASIPSSVRRKELDITYATKQGGKASTGNLWAWFPLRDTTTASGVFNAPWQVNDDRTSLIFPSLLNKTLLGEGAELFLDVVAKESSREDPAAHFDLFPARGREAHGRADKFLTNAIPLRASRRAIIPDASGTLRNVGYFGRIPNIELLSQYRECAQVVKAWISESPRTNFPHWTCFTTPQRRLRLRTLLAGASEGKSDHEYPLAAWLTELAESSESGARTAINIAAQLTASSGELGEAIRRARIVPVEGGHRVALSDCDTVLLPSSESSTPSGIRIIAAHAANDEVTRASLSSLGFKTVSADEIATALSAAATKEWSDQDWMRFWRVLQAASPHVGQNALNSMRNRGLAVMVPTRAGSMRRASEVLLTQEFAPQLTSRHADPNLVPDVRLLRAAGAFASPKPHTSLEQDRVYLAYVEDIRRTVVKELRDQGIRVRQVSVPRPTGVGPLDLLLEDLTTGERTRWTHAIIKSAPPHATCSVERADRIRETRPVPTPERWAVLKHGLIETSLGPQPADHVLGRATFESWQRLMPVAIDAQHDEWLDLPSIQDDVPASLLEQFIARTDHRIQPSDHTALATILDLAAWNEDVPIPQRIPALLRGVVGTFPRTEVVVTDSDEDLDALHEAGVPYIPSNREDEALVDRWGLLSATEALELSVEVTGAHEQVAVGEMFPSLSRQLDDNIDGQLICRATLIERVIRSQSGVTRLNLRSALRDDVVFVDAKLGPWEQLREISRSLDLKLSEGDIETVLKDDEELRHSALIADAREAPDDTERLLVLVGESTLRQRLPDGVLAAVEARHGELDAHQVADLFLRVHGQDSIRVLREDLAKRKVPLPRNYDGSPDAQQLVKQLGFDTSFAGSRETRKPPVTQVQGRIELPPLHPYQVQLARHIGVLATTRDPEKRRGLLYLPTGAGKTRVAVQAVLDLLQRGEIASPVLWIAQSEELCEQAINSFEEVWRAMGDHRPLEISRFWSGYEVDESEEDLQVVVCIDDTLKSRIHSPEYDWLANAGMVIIDEAHSAGSKQYTGILRRLGITTGQTDRPLLGLTATPFRGQNEEINRRFAQRFGSNRLESLDPDDPIGQLREMRILAHADHEILEGMQVDLTEADALDFKIGEISRQVLSKIGGDLNRTQSVVEHVRATAEKHSDWPILVFAASVSSAHTIAALLRLEGIEADSVDGTARKGQRRRVIEKFKNGDTQVLVNCDLLTQGFDAPKVRALYIARPTFSPNRYLQMVGRGLRGPLNGGTDRCLVVNVKDTFEQFGDRLAYTDFDYLWSPS